MQQANVVAYLPSEKEMQSTFVPASSARDPERRNDQGYGVISNTKPWLPLPSDTLP